MKEFLWRIKNKIIPKQSELEFLISMGLKIGNNVSVFTSDCFDSQWPWLIHVGDNVCISTNCKILAHDASTSQFGYTKVGTVTIGSNVFIGSGTTVLCNTHIGDNVIIGAGSLVTGKIQSNGVYAGVPAKFICSFEDYKIKTENNIKNKKLFTKYKWNEWIDAPIDEKEKMFEELKNDYGYVK